MSLVGRRLHAYQRVKKARVRRITSHRSKVARPAVVVASEKARLRRLMIVDFLVADDDCKPFPYCKVPQVFSSIRL